MINDFDIIVVRGAPGVGKTTLGELLKMSDTFKAVIDIDEVRHMLNSEKFIYAINTDYFNSILAASNLIDLLVDTGLKPIVVIDVFSKLILDFFLKNLTAKKIAIVTLISTDEELANRMTNRINGYINLEVAAKVNLHIKQTHYESDTTIDTTFLKPKEVLNQFLKSFEPNF